MLWRRGRRGEEEFPEGIFAAIFGLGMAGGLAAIQGAHNLHLSDQRARAESWAHKNFSSLRMAPIKFIELLSGDVCKNFYNFLTAV